jgi:SAM-dependent methyltransferase
VIPLPTPFDRAERRLQPELMDSPELDRASHLQALDALARVNAVSLTARRVWTEIARLERRGVRPVRVLDIACGGGDVLVSVARRARRLGIAVDLHGCDVSPVALQRAREHGGDALGVAFHALDAVRDPLPGGHDLLCTSLFLHHLSSEDALHLLRAMAGATRRAVFVQDLRRTGLGYALALAGLSVLTRSVVAREDGLVSVRAAFTLSEVGMLCREAELADAEVRGCWPQRFTIRWTRP